MTVAGLDLNPSGCRALVLNHDIMLLSQSLPSFKIFSLIAPVLINYIVSIVIHSFLTPRSWSKIQDGTDHGPRLSCSLPNILPLFQSNDQIQWLVTAKQVKCGPLASIQDNSKGPSQLWSFLESTEAFVVTVLQFNLSLYQTCFFN